MHAHPVARLKRCFAITSLVRVVTLIVVVGALALAALPIKAQSGSAFVHVNQVKCR